ncbi:MAG: ABC transporter ATP-binding protein [Candidatus Bathyarchaeia archaeon]
MGSVRGMQLGPRVGPRGPMYGRRVERAKNPRVTLIRLGRYILKYRFLLLLVGLLVVASSVLSLIGPYLIGVAIDSYILKGDLPGLARIAALMFLIYLAGWVAQASQSLIMVKVSQRVLYTLRKNLFEHLQTLSLSFFDRHPHGELMSRLTNDIDAINMALTQNITQLISSLLSLSGILVAMFKLNQWLASASLTVLPIMVFITALIARRTMSGFRGLQTELGRLNGIMEEVISGERVVLAFSRQESVLKQFDEANIRVRDTATRAISHAMLIPPLINVMSSMSIAIVAVIGGWMTIQGMATIGLVATFITYTRNFVQPLRQLADLFNSVQNALAGAERVFELLDEKPEVSDKPDARPLQEIKGEVNFDHVSFSYTPGVPVLKDVSLHAKPGQVIALVGPTGAGKTTMANILSRFYDIQEGAIRIDGVDIRDVTMDSLRRQIGTVLQDDFLFADTVLENIRYGNLEATDEECIEAAKMADADQFIVRLPEGYNTLLAERGSNLSQGQRQLLAIARVIVANPKILVLDEATSSVDTRTERRIQGALMRLMKGRTSFIIAHRLSTIRNADQVLVIREGRVVERGTHETLLKIRGFYHQLYMSQFRGTLVEPRAVISST